ncbi:MAG TPA: 50S ribosomal protein L11 methyltransferase [Bellilinea sp.]|nr:50S ribosomal protein L11 methyltransferase [Bellilinea sp.]
MAEAHWLEVSLTVDGELAEAAADVIGRYTSQGVVMEQAVKYNDAEDVGTPYGPIRVFGYIAVDTTLEQKRQHLEEALWHLGQIQPLPPLSFKKIEDQDWMQAWKEHYRPIPIGQKILILPAWLESEYPERISVKIDPSMAFGTGTHPTTQLCLALLEKYLKAGQNVIDVGCGSGILSIGAIKLGAAKALAVDIDNAAIISTHENAQLNGVDEWIEAGVGSSEEVHDEQFSIEKAPVVVANILAPVIVRLFAEQHLADLVEKKGIILLSGILDEQAAAVVAEAEEHGLELVETMQINDWVALAMRRK